VRRARPIALAVALAALAVSACDKFEYLPNDPVPPIPTRVLLHRGSGNLTSPPPNTLEAMLYGASHLDGAEMDLEISKDGTLWLGHDNEILECDGVTFGPCFQDLTNAEIEQRADCGDGVRRYDRLDVVLPALKAAYPSKLYSFDIKGQYCASLSEAGVVTLAQDMAEEVDRLVRASAFDWRVMAESQQPAFSERLKELSAPVHLFVVSLGDIDQPLSDAAALGAAGISMKYAPTDPDVEPLTASVVQGIHQAGQRIAVWTVNGSTDANAVWATQPDVIQTDDADFYAYLPLFPPAAP
jgi:glycerophosphoryl diester phosphodiesterase